MIEEIDILNSEIKKINQRIKEFLWKPKYFIKSKSD